MKDYGLKLGGVSLTDYFYGKLPKDIINPSGDWTKFLPVYEPQMLADGKDPQSCHIWGLENAIETYLNCIAPKTEAEWNLSERFVYNGMNYGMTGGDPFENGLWISNNGVVDESVLPMTKTYAEFIKPRPLTESLKQRGLLFLDRFDFKQEYLWNDNRETVSPEDKRKMITECLRYSPLGISLYAWAQNMDGMYYRPNNAPDTHWCVIFKENPMTYSVFDSYLQDIKLVRKDMIDLSSICVRYYITEKKPVASLSFFQRLLAWFLNLFK